MKKILLFCAVALALNSCSSDDSSSDSSSSVLLKKTIETDSEGTKITTNYTYDAQNYMLSGFGINYDYRPF